MPPEEPEAPGAVESTAMAVAGLAFGLAILLLRGATPLPAGLFDAGAALLAGFGLAPLLHRRAGALWGTLLRGAGVAAATLLLARSLVAPFDAAGFPAALLVAGGTLLQARARSGRGGLALDAAGLVLLAAGWGVAWWQAPVFPEPQRLRLALLLALPALALGLVLRALALRRGYHALAPMPVGILLASLLAAVYLSYRALVAQQVGNLPLYEWTLGVGVAALLLARLRRHARAQEVPEAWESDARRHAQDVSPLYDARMAPLAGAVSRYLDTGEGYEAYQAALRRVSPSAPYRKALESVRPVPPARGRAARRSARARRLEAHRALLLTLRNERGSLHGSAPPPLRTDP